MKKNKKKKKEEKLGGERDEEGAREGAGGEEGKKERTEKDNASFAWEGGFLYNGGDDSRFFFLPCISSFCLLHDRNE